VEESPAGEVTDGSRHPYTRALFSATPGLLDPIEPIPLTGPVPSATRPPSGCPFRTRCWKADEECATRMPEFTAASTPGHRFRCHHPVEEGRSTRTLVAQAESAAGATAMADVPFQQHIREP
jgi:peptide/nickel transport system ATP-binding protein